MQSRVARFFGVAVVVGIFGMPGCASDPVSTATSLYQQLGGAESISKMAGSLVGSAAKDPRLAELMGGVDKAAASPKIADQLCATLGGGCAAPFTDNQIAAAEDKLTPDQKVAVKDGLKSSLKTLGTNPAVHEAATKALGPKLGGILSLL